MVHFFKKLWARIEPWLQWIEHWDFLSKAGLSGLLVKGMPALAVVTTAILGYLDRMPRMLVFLAMLGAAVLAMAVVFLWRLVRNEKQSERSIQKTANKRGTLAPVQAPPSMGAGSVLFVAAVTAIIVIIGIYYVNMHYAMDNTELSVNDTGTHLPNGSAPFGVNLAWLNKGPLKIDNIRAHAVIDPQDHVLTQVEEDQHFNMLVVFSPLEVALNELHRGDINWRTMYNKTINVNDWNKVLVGSEFIYVFAYFDFFVNGQEKATEKCFFITKDFPSAHNCIGHNRVLYK